MCFDSIAQKNFEELWKHLKDLHVDVIEIWRRWLLRFFVGVLPYQCCLNVVDLFLLEGNHTLLRVGCALLEVLEPALREAKTTRQAEKLLLCIKEVPFEVIFTQSKKYDLPRRALRQRLLSNMFLLRKRGPVEGSMVLFERPLLSAPSKVVSALEFEAILSFLPSRLHVREPVLIFSTNRDGYNLKTFAQKNEPFEQTLFFIKTTEGKRFGAFLSKGWKLSKNFYGNGECFVFSFETTVIKHGWRSGQKDFYMKLSKDSLNIGGGAIWLDEFFSRGRTGFSDTYNSPPLDGSETDLSSSSFSLSVLETYGFPRYRRGKVTGF